MAIQWQWKEPGGTVTMLEEGGKETTLNWFEGNCLMIALNEWEEEGTPYHSLSWFFADVRHAKALLGLTGNEESIFKDAPITKITINRNFVYQWKELIDVLTKAFPDIEITLRGKPMPDEDE